MKHLLVAANLLVISTALPHALGAQNMTSPLGDEHLSQKFQDLSTDVKAQQVRAAAPREFNRQFDEAFKEDLLASRAQGPSHLTLCAAALGALRAIDAAKQVTALSQKRTYFPPGTLYTFEETVYLKEVVVAAVGPAREAVENACLKGSRGKVLSDEFTTSIKTLRERLEHMPPSKEWLTSGSNSDYFGGQAVDVNIPVLVAALNQLASDVSK